MRMSMTPFPFCLWAPPRYTPYLACTRGHELVLSWLEVAPIDRGISACKRTYCQHHPLYRFLLKGVFGKQLPILSQSRFR